MSYPFVFKEFTIHQENTAMKVGTDGVLLGA
ncbi:MAG: tRNA (adenine-N(6)-)-methyltransferase, partial [Flavobacterium sp.]|nr:tRNA (adenine-N(6)-)-methyltransferase [Flavobacterium sp.]